MNASIGLERTRSVVAGAYRGWRWALPIACGLALTTALESPLAHYLGAEAPAVSQPGRESLAPGDVIGKFLFARQVHDVDAAIAFFETDAAITDSDGTTARGRDAAMRLMERYDGMVAGAPQVTGDEVVWTEAFPIRTPDNLQFQQDTQPELAAEIPYYAFVQAMCAVVTNGKIHAVFALAAAETFVPRRHCAGDVDPNSASTT
jgi:hypothetical protein